jgi:hypothetical protein
MAEANARLQQTPTEAQAQTMNGAVVVLAWRSAKEAVTLAPRPGIEAATILSSRDCRAGRGLSRRSSCATHPPSKGDC